jgi:hypothetical protein
MGADPFSVLGLERGASADDVLAARRRLAKDLHPDVGGDQVRMQEVNAAAQAALAIVSGSSDAAAGTPPSPRRRGAPSGSTRAAGSAGDRGWRVAQDSPSLTIEALPAEAFEAIAVVTTWIGEALIDDPPYLLEAHLYEPFECWCRIELVPDAGASSVSLTVAVDDGTLPDVDAVRDVYVANLNRLDWDEVAQPPGASPPPP